MIKVTETKRTDYKYLLGNYNHVAIAEKLSQIFNGEYAYLANTFLKPGYYQDRITWSFTANNVRIISQSNYNQLAVGQQEEIHQFFNRISRSFSELSSRYPIIEQLGNQICTIPSLSDVFLLSTNLGDVIAISNWGLIPFDRDERYTTFAKVIPPGSQYVDVKLRIIYPGGQPVFGEKFKIEKGNHLIPFITDEAGYIVYGKASQGEKINVYYGDDHDIETIGGVQVDAKISEYEIELNVLSDLNISVLDHANYPVAGHRVLINNEQYYSDEYGKINLVDLPVGADIHLEADSVPALKVGINKSNDDVIINLPKPKVSLPREMVKFYLYDRRRNPLVGEILSLTIGSDKILTEHVAKNCFKVEASSLPVDEKINARIIFSNSKFGKVKKCSFIHRKEDKEHHLYLKRNWWLWLLWFLPLFLLLLLTFDQDLSIIVENENEERLSGISLALDYNQKYLYNFTNNSFLSVSNDQRDALTDSNGEAIIEGIRTTLFDHIFYYRRDARIEAAGDANCFSEADTIFRIHRLAKEMHITVPSTIQGIIVLDEKKKSPIANADVEIDNSGIIYKTDESGIIALDSINRCDIIDAIAVRHMDYMGKRYNNLEVIDHLNEQLYLELTLESPKSCDDTIGSGEDKDGLFVFYLPDVRAVYKIKYDFNNVSDRLITYKGKDVSGELIRDYGSQSGRNEISFRPMDYCGGCNYITVFIDSNKQTHTVWKVSLECP